MGKQLRDALKSVISMLSGKKNTSTENITRDTGTRQDRKNPTTETSVPQHKRDLQSSNKNFVSWKDKNKSNNTNAVPFHASSTKASGTATQQSGKNLLKHAPAEPAAVMPRLVLTRQFHPNPLLVDEAVDIRGLPRFESSGIERQLTDTPENETDLTIGLDFGTSSTKVVIRDPFSAMGVFPVLLNGNIHGIDGYLLPSRVFRTDEIYSLDFGEHRIGNLKMSLLGSGVKNPVTEFNECCAYLALIIRRAKAWMFTTHRDIYSRHRLNWKVNLGIAARSYRERDTVDLFRRLAWAAANVAADQEAKEITTEVVNRYRVKSLEVFSNGDVGADSNLPFSIADVDVVPEVSAQLQGFMVSARWNWDSQPIMMLVDVGAGTVDSALFHVDKPAGKPGKLTFYSSRVEQNGVMNLHRARVDWLKDLLPNGNEHDDAHHYLERTAKSTDRLKPIPASVTEYLPGYVLEIEGKDIDRLFQKKRYRTQIAGCLIDARIGKSIRINQLQKVPLLLCGGGARMALFSNIAKMINDTPGWLVSVELTRLPVPIELEDIGWHTEDFDRISVAYGLSLAGDGQSSLGRIVRDIDVPDAQPQVRNTDYHELFVSKDQV